MFWAAEQENLRHLQYMGEPTTNYIVKLSRSRVTVHLVFILFTAVTLLLTTRYYFGMASAIAWQACVFILYFFVCVYTGRWISKTWFIQDKFITFSIATLISFVALLCIGKLVLNALLPFNQKNIDEFFFGVTPLFIFGMLAGIFIPMIRSLSQRQVAEAKRSAEQVQGELNLLRSQLSPHFLFNTLNNLYGISITQHEKLPALLLKLSELLRYSVYETRETYIPLAEEIQYINNYISFEKIRVGERLDLKTNIQETGGNQIRIAPMLLIVFIENAFKHSKNSLDETIFVDIVLKSEQDKIILKLTNSCGKINPGKGGTGSGQLGLMNVKKRLQILYAGEYFLEEKRTENAWSVTLELKAK